MDTQFFQSKPPLIIEALHCSVFGVCIPLLEVIDESTGKELRHLDLILQSAKRSGLEDIFICIDEQSPQGKDIVAYIEYLIEKKKKRLGKLRVEILRFQGVLNRADLLRRLEEGWSSAFSRGFFWVSGTVNAPFDFELLHETHKTAFKKDSSTIATFYPCQISPLSCMSIPDERSVIVTDGKTNELLAYLRYNGYTQDSLDFKSLIPLEGRWEIPRETLTVRSDLYLTDFFFGTSELLKVMRENFDFVGMTDIVDHALRGEIKTEAIYLVTKHLKTFSKSQFASESIPHGSQITHGRQLYETLRNDALKDSDKIVDQGTRSCWKYDPKSRTVTYETVKLTSKCTVASSLLMQGVDIEEEVHLEHSIVGRNVKIPKGCHLTNVVVCEGVQEIPNNTKFRNGVLTMGTLAASSDAYYPPETCGSSLLFYRPVDSNLFVWNEVPNHDWKEHSKTLENDPSRDPDRMYDELYGHSDNAHSSSDEEDDEIKDDEFKREIGGMLNSVIDKPEHVRNLILELRTYRLSSNKSDLLVLEAVIPVILNWMQDNVNLERREAKKFENSVLGELLEAFSSADDPRAQCIILDACWREFGHTNIEKLVSCLYLLQPYMLQEDVLMEWVKADAKRNAALSINPVFIRYGEWLLAEESEEGSSD